MRALFGLIVLALTAPVYADWAVPAMNEHIDQTNFVVNANCSGTLIDLENRYVLTANHCIANQYETLEREKIDEDGGITTEKYRRLKSGTVRQLVFDGTLQVQEITYRTKVIAFDKARDLAVLQIIAPLSQTLAAALSCAEPMRGESVFVVGNPTGTLYSSVVSGIVSSIQRSYELIQFGDASFGQQALMQISGGVVGGNSGGAVYDAAGLLIGVPVIANRTNETIAFAVPIDVIRAFLADKKIGDPCSESADDADDADDADAPAEGKGD